MPRPVHWSEQPDLLIKAIAKVKNSRSRPMDESRTYTQMFYNRPENLSKGGGAIHVIDTQGLRDLGFNVLAEACLGAQSQLCKPLVAVVSPINLPWEAQRTCDSLGQLIGGIMEATGFRAIAAQLTLDGMLCPEGFAIWEPDPLTSDFRCVRLDPLASFYSQDRQEFVTIRPVSRRWLKAVYGKDPELKAAIDLLKAYQPEHIVGVDAADSFANDDTVAWYEGFVAPIGAEVPGKHVVQLSKDIIIASDEWTTGIPVVSSRWSDGFRGPTDGKPLARSIAPFMAWENEMHLKMQDSLAGSVPWVVGPHGTKMPSDAPFQFVELPPDGGTVTVTVPRTVSQDVRIHSQDLHAAALKTAGVSEQAAQGTAPPQYKSGVALSRWVDIISTRLSQQHQVYAELWTASGRILAARGPEVYKSRPINVRKAAGSDIISQIKWDDVSLPEKSYSLSFDVVSALGETVAQRLENLQTVKDLGGIDLGQLLQHLNVPDFRAVVKRINGPRNYLEHQIGKALNEGIIEPPMAMQDPAVCEKSVGEAYLSALSEDPRPPKDNLNACRVLWRLFKAKAAPPAPPPTPAPPSPSLSPNPSPMDPAAFASPGPLPEAPPPQLPS